jgi:hypothetical protein
MKSYKIERIRMSFTPNSSEKIRLEAEAFINRKAAAGCEIVTVSFDTASNNGYIYCYITYRE